MKRSNILAWRGAQAGYYCSVCDCILRDSMSYLDHINGKYHNRALGMNMRVERSNADQARPHQGFCIVTTGVTVRSIRVSTRASAVALLSMLPWQARKQ